MCTAAPTGESARSALGRVYDRIMGHIFSNRNTSPPRPNDGHYASLRTKYEEAHKYTHRKCTEYTEFAFEYRDVITMVTLGEVGLLNRQTPKKSRNGADYSQLSDDTEEIDAELEEENIIENVEKLYHLCRKARTLESQAKSELRKHEKKSKYHKSQKYEKYQVKAAMKKLEDEAEQNEKT
ncbi:hypothetical protein BASA50_005061 [Batrachochytrium salamandrivorans]|uniref:Uncharacterized protein n=1 Tax=Batrachochytrium salamandrivorans TaxID=1357716 RepID=A0ABQ8FDR6_9FUNG|nr:hypothetical protein BASA62_001562 [Batrachochytrium salamandrivorans]KAH6596511.1 hypothetical protein BASA50_005061 [Batrachochytrium salamandrivorans]KAH9245575.1 hypothetical protein BASA81_016934 [Batrachochytrium salamandrivorans]